MRNILVALVVGIVFGAGLALSDMVNPARVLAFLDIFGSWDPALAFVMGAAVLVSAAAYFVRRRMGHPLLAGRFNVPDSRQIDRRLLAGTALFGIGWGLVGFCPGPALAGLAFGLWQPWIFLAAMLAGMLIHRIAYQPRPVAKP